MPYRTFIVTLRRILRSSQEYKNSQKHEKSPKNGTFLDNFVSWFLVSINALSIAVHVLRRVNRISYVL